MTPTQRFIERLNAQDEGPISADWFAAALAEYRREKGTPMEDTKTTTMITPPAAAAAAAAAGQVSGQAASLAAALAGAGAVVSTRTSVVIKPGWKTSEFWLTALFATGSTMVSVIGALPPPWGWIASGAVVLGYNISRGLAKR